MAGKTVKVNIDGSDYSLTSDNEPLLIKAAGTVNNQMIEIKRAYNYKLTPDVVSVLASLNLAESYLKNQQDYEKEINLINNELAKMVQQLKEILK